MTEPDNVGAGLAKSGGESELFGVIRERNEPGFAVAIVAHEDCEFPARRQDTGTIPNERGVAVKECGQRGCAGQVAQIRRVNFLTPVGRMRPYEIERCAGG